MLHWALWFHRLYLCSAGAAECPPFGAILPCHFISDSISSALVLLKGGEALVASSVCLVIYWCWVQACVSSLLQPVVWTGVARTGLSSRAELDSSGAPSLCAKFSGFSGPSIHRNEQESCLYCKAYIWHTLKSPACTHMQKHLNMLNERCVSVRYVGKCLRYKTNYHHWLNNHLCKLKHVCSELQPSRQSWFIENRIHKF